MLDRIGCTRTKHMVGVPHRDVMKQRCLAFVRLVLMSLMRSCAWGVIPSCAETVASAALRAIKNLSPCVFPVLAPGGRPCLKSPGGSCTHSEYAAVVRRLGLLQGLYVPDVMPFSDGSLSRLSGHYIGHLAVVCWRLARLFTFEPAAPRLSRTSTCNICAVRL
jgi:hypothetical protein